MSIEHSRSAESFERQHEPDYELAGSLQAILNNLAVRDYEPSLPQSEALEAIGNALVKGTPSGYIEMPTGIGKTMIASLLAEAAVRANRRVLMLAPTRQIAEQLIGDSQSETPTGLARFAHLPDRARISRQFGTRKAHRGSNIVVSTYQSFLGDDRTNSGRLDNFDIVIADECHRSLGEQTSEALKRVYPNAFKLGLSATPDFAADRRSVEVYERQLYRFSLLEAVESGKTAPVRALIYETGSLLSTADRQKEFTDKERSPLVHNLERNGTAISLAKSFVEDGRQGIIACIPGSNNLHARLMADLLKRQGIRAVEIGYHLDHDAIAQRLKAYEQGVIDILTFTKALDEGWDSKAASFVINTVPTTSPVRTTQMLGRILRPKTDGRESIYVDFIDTVKGIPKLQYTALHALGLEDIDLDRVLGGSRRTTHQKPPTQLLEILDPELMEQLLKTQGKLLQDVLVKNADDPLVREWENRLRDEGLPAELPENPVLTPVLSKKVNAARTRFVHDNGVEPNIDELLELLEPLSKPQRQLLGRYAIRAEFTDEMMAQYEDQPTDPEHDFEALLLEREFLEQLETALDTLSELEKEVIKLRYGIGEPGSKTLEAIGKVFDRSKERMRQIESKALSKLRHPLRSDLLRDYLDGQPDEGMPEKYRDPISDYYDKSVGLYVPPKSLNLARLEKSLPYTQIHLLLSEEVRKFGIDDLSRSSLYEVLGVLNYKIQQTYHQHQVLHTKQGSMFDVRYIERVRILESKIDTYKELRWQITQIIDYISK